MKFFVKIEATVPVEGVRSFEQSSAICNSRSLIAQSTSEIGTSFVFGLSTFVPVLDDVRILNISLTKTVLDLRKIINKMV